MITQTTYPTPPAADCSVEETTTPRTPRPATVLRSPVATPADTSDFAAVHRCLRLAGRALADRADYLSRGGFAPTSSVRALGRYWDGYKGEVLAHHTIEDTIFYPALIARVPSIGEAIERIDSDHHLLDELMDEADTEIASVVSSGTGSPAAARVLHRLDEVMHRHLDFEDADIVPLFARHFTNDEYVDLTKQAMASLGLGKQALFTVPFIGAWVAPADLDNLLDEAPLAFRIIYRLTRRRHARLTARALGDSRQRSFDSHSERG